MVLLVIATHLFFRSSPTLSFKDLLVLFWFICRGKYVVLLFSGCSWLETVPHGKGKAGCAIQLGVSVVASPFKSLPYHSCRSHVSNSRSPFFSCCLPTDAVFDSHPAQEGASVTNHRIIELRWFGLEATLKII